MSKPVRFNNHMPIIIAIDYDDTIVFQDFPNAGTIKPKAQRNINKLYDEGYKILIWTCRKDDRKDTAANYLREQGVRFHAINENLPEVIEFWGSDTRKLSADIYVDDKQLGGLPDDWDLIYDLIKKQIEQYR